jgi:hypothetical protein
VRQVETDTPVFEAPAPSVYRSAEPPVDAVLGPFAVYEKHGEALMRRQLAALAAWHLVNIIEKYDLGDEPAAVLSRLPAAALIERIVSAARSHGTIHHA